MASVILWPVSPASHKLPGPNRWVATGPSVQLPRQFYWAADSRWLWGHRETLGSRGHSQCGSYRARSLGTRRTQLPYSNRARRAWSAEVESPLSHQGRKHRLTGQGRFSTSSLSTHGSQVPAANCRVSLQPLRAQLPQLRHRRGRSLASVHENRHRKETRKPGLWAQTQQWDTRPRRGP